MDFLSMIPFTFCLLQSLVCYAYGYSEEINSTEGVVKSPNYPNLYPKNLRYSWRITVREKFTIKLLFTDFYLQQRRRGDCKDHLQIFDGKDENTQSLFKECGKPFRNTVHSVFSSGNDLFLKLTTDGRNQKRGFSANFTSLPYYSEEINSTEGVVKSPNYPNLYPNNLRYTWRITVKENFTIQLLFTDFYLQQRQQGVCKDKLQIFDGNDENTQSLFKECGKPFRNTVHSVFSSRNDLFLKLTTDGRNRKTGFSANFTSLPYYSEEINSTEGVEKSPNYPNLYPNNLRYTWRITVRENFTIQLLFTYFHLQQRQQGVCKDILQIYDGEDENSPKIFTECRGPVDDLNPVSSSGNELFLKLTTDGSNQKRGFFANFTSISLTESSPTQTLINTTKTISTSVTAKATISSTATIAELFHSSFLPDEHTTFPILIKASSFDTYTSSAEPTTKRPHVSEFLRVSAPALYAIVPSVLLMLGLLVFGLFVTLKKSIKESLSPTTDHSNHGETTTNQGANVAEPPEIMVEDGRTEGCNTILLSEFVTMTIDGEENGKVEADKSRGGEILNIVYESYDDEVNEAAYLRGEDSDVAQSHMTYHKDSGVAKQDTTYEEVDDKHSDNIVYESYDCEVNEAGELQGVDSDVAKSDMTCHEDGGVAKQDTTYEEVDDKHSDSIMYDDICMEREKGFEINIVYEPS